MSARESLSPTARGPFAREAARTFGAALVVVAFGLLMYAGDPRFFWHDDNQTYHLPGRMDVARAWREGEVPLLSPYSWQCGALAGEYQFAVFSVFEAVLVTTVFALELSLPASSLILALVYLTVLGTGAFRLARGRGLSTDLALLVCLVATLNGWIIPWAAMSCLAALAGLAWLPWFWWALERAVEGGRGPTCFVGAALFLYLIAVSGWPFSLLMSGVLVVLQTLKVWRQTSSLKRAWPVAAAVGVGLALAAPAWLMLIEYSAHTVRSGVSLKEWSWAFSVPFASLLGLVFPPWVSEWVIASPKPRQSMEFVGGLVPVVVLLTGIIRLGIPFLRKHAWEMLLLGLILVLALLPSMVGSFRMSFRWLPLFFLLLGLLAAHALADLRGQGDAVTGTSAPYTLNLGCRAAALVAPVGLIAWLADMEPVDYVLWHALALTGLALTWALAEHFSAPRSPVRTWMPCVVLLTAAWFHYQDVDRFVEYWTWPLDESIRRPEPLDPSRRYLSVHNVEDTVQFGPSSVLNLNQGSGVGLRPSNSWMYAAVPGINGYTPMGPLGPHDVFRYTSHTSRPAEDAERVLEHWSAPGGFLDFVDINGLIVADRYAPRTGSLAAHGWQREKTVDGGTVYHRGKVPARHARAVDQAWLAEDRGKGLHHLLSEKGPHTPVLVGDTDGASGSSLRHFSPVQITVLQNRRNRVEVEVVNTSAKQEALVVFLRPWYPGYRAHLNGAERPVVTLDLTMPAVSLPPGAQGHLVLEYRPKSLVRGCWIAGAALATILGVLLFSLRV